MSGARHPMPLPPRLPVICLAPPPVGWQPARPRRTHWRRVAVGAAAVLGLLALAGQATAQTAGFAMDRQDLRAQLIPQRYTTLSAELGAKISRIAVKEGETFKAGQVLVVFDCALQKAQLDRASAQQASAQNTLDGNRQMAKLNAIGQVELRNSEAELLKAQADVAYLQTTLDKCTISAPFDGRAAEQKAREQQFVQPGQAVIDLIDDSQLELEFIVPSRWLTWLKPGHTLATAIDETRKTYPVRLLRLAAKADPVSQSVKCVGVVDGRFPELLAGMSGRVLLAAPR